MARLSVNLNKVALLRNSRHTGVPDVLDFARIVLKAGVGITVHPRPDERHIRESDVPALSKLMKPFRPKVEFNIEGYPDARFLKIVSAVRPEQCTLVPDSPTAFTSEQGFTLGAAQMRLVRKAVARLKKIRSRVILFVEPDPSVISRVVESGSNGIEIRTGDYAEAFRTGKHADILNAIAETAEEARRHGLVVNVGHDLNLKNIPPLVARVPFLAEASIGHELTADALRMGFALAIDAYAAVLSPSKTRNSRMLDESNVSEDPFKQFSRWFKEADTLPLSNAVVLATAAKNGKPSARTVLLKQFNERGFVFYTNYASRKARELGENKHAALLFHWPSLERQIRISGRVEKVSRKESEEYFRTRSHESRLGAWASPQSTRIETRAVLDAKMEELRKKYKGKSVPLPPFWGGFRLVPDEFEFWQGQPNRLHDRLCYVRGDKRTWRLSRLSP